MAIVTRASSIDTSHAYKPQGTTTTKRPQRVRHPVDTFNFSSAKVLMAAASFGGSHVISQGAQLVVVVVVGAPPHDQSLPSQQPPQQQQFIVWSKLRPSARPSVVARDELAAPLALATSSMLRVDKPTPSVTTGHKRPIVLPDNCREKRPRFIAWTELEYERILEEATLLREELGLLLYVAIDLCRDLGRDATSLCSFSATLATIGDVMAASQALTVPQIRDMCQHMLAMMQYLCRVHYAHFALIDMQDQLRACRNRFMLFIGKNAARMGL